MIWYLLGVSIRSNSNLKYKGSKAQIYLMENQIPLHHQRGTDEYFLVKGILK